MLGFLFLYRKGENMKYTPNRTDKKMRAIYCILFAIAVLGIFIEVNGIYATLIQCASIIILTASLAIFIKYETITYVYSLMDRNDILDFYVNKYTGKRGGYVCYFPLTDCRLLEKYDKDTKKKLKNEYKRIFFFNYSKNVYTGTKYVAVFENKDEFDAIIFEPDENFLTLMKSGMNAYNIKTDE